MTNTLAKLGFKGKVILDNKQWHLNKLESQNDWVSAMRQTYEKMDANGKSIVGGFSFGETTADDESWAAYSKGVAEAVQKLERSFQLKRQQEVFGRQEVLRWRGELWRIVPSAQARGTCGHQEID